MVTKSTSIYREMKEIPILKITGIFQKTRLFKIPVYIVASNFARFKRFAVFLICQVTKDTFDSKFGEMCL